MDKDKFYGFSTGELLALRDMWRELIRVVPWEGEDRDLYKRVFDKIHELNVCIANRIDEGQVEIFVDYSNCMGDPLSPLIEVGASRSIVPTD